jgi:D-beta-D-heptose 7-phosphate kinase/D-beta-D-heptose 1-phosphate adenosyltransferase
MKKIVWCNGSFDVIHYGHFKLLEYAASLGELHVGIDSSERIRDKKGKDRPFHTWSQRSQILLGFKFVHQTYFFGDDDTLSNLIKTISPDIMVIGGDYRDKPIIGVEHIKKVVYFDRIEGLSTTNIINSWDTQKNL